MFVSRLTICSLDIRGAWLDSCGAQTACCTIRTKTKTKRLSVLLIFMTFVEAVKLMLTKRANNMLPVLIWYNANLLT